MIKLRMRTEGIAGMSAELLTQTEKDARPLVARAAVKLYRRIYEKLSVSNGPAAPGEPPAMAEGALRDTLGRTGPFTQPGTVSAVVGIGVGDEATRRVAEWKERDVNVFEYALLHEEGGLGGEGGQVRYPARSYLRTSEAELEAEIAEDWARGL